MKILAFDTSAGRCSVALWQDGAILAVKSDLEATRQAERLLLVINELLAEVGSSYAVLDAIGVTVGPGSFTGVRIGLAAARGISLASGKPVVGVSSFESVAFQARHEHGQDMPVCVVLDARRGEVFTQAFSAQGSPLNEAVLLQYSEVAGAIPDGNVRLVGNGVRLVRPMLSGADVRVQIAGENMLPEATSIAHIAAQKLTSQSFTPRPGPLYIRKPDAKIKGQG